MPQGTITSADMREANRIAATMPRGHSTPVSRLAVATKDYENATARLGQGPTGHLRAAPGARIGEGARRKLAAFEPENAPDVERYAAGEGTDLDEALTAYGYGRALERARQEARFGAVDAVGPSWGERLRRVACDN